MFKKKHRQTRQTRQTRQQQMTSAPARPRPFNENLTHLERKFDSIVTLAKDSTPFNKAFEDAMTDMVRMAEHVGVLILTQKRHKAAMPRLPSEVWHFMLTEFGGVNVDQQNHIPIMFLRPIQGFLPLPVIWDIYTSQTTLYAERVKYAEDCRDCMKRFLHIMS